MAMFVMHFYFVFTMSLFGRVVFIYIAIRVSTAAEIKSKMLTGTLTPKSTVLEKFPGFSPQPSNAVKGVLSIAGVESRNGRVSSMNGFKFYPAIDSSMINTDDKGNFILKDINGKMPSPLTITKEGDGVSGTIHISPGSVSVMSSANSGSGPAFKPWPAPFMPPMMTDIFFPPFPVFNTRIPEPYFPKDMFKQSLPQHDMLRPGWFLPPYTPFYNFW